MPRPQSLWLLTVVGLLAAIPANALAQDHFPPGPEVGPSPTPTGPGDAGLGGLTCPPLLTARPPSAWYADGEMAVLFTGAAHANERFLIVRDHNPVFVSPRVYLGRRFEGGGSVRFTYRNLTEVGQLGTTYEPEEGWSSGRTFTTNWFDLDYVSREYAPLRWWRLQCELGGRFVFRHESWWQRTPYARHDTAQNFFGGGPHFGLTSHWLLGQSGWAFYGRADTAVTFGENRGAYRYRPGEESASWGAVPRSETGSFGEFQFDLGLQLALTRRWEWRGRSVGLGLGVQADVLTVGPLKGEFNSFGLVNVGPFLRCEVGF
jgi:hypothetical protein